MAHLESITVFPVKSAAGIAVEEAAVEARGLAGDRRWMVVDSEGRFLTQRTHHHMALLGVAQEGDGIRLSAPGMDGIQVAMPGHDAASMEVVVWNDRVAALPAGEVADAWLTSFMGKPCRLVYMPESTRRPVDPKYDAEGVVSFADGYPVLLLGEGSMSDLNTRLEAPVGYERFRPNLYVSGTDPYEEDTWSEVTVGEVRFRVVKPCARCVVPTIDPATGMPGKEPLRTLSGYRSRDGKVYFAQNLIPLHKGIIRTGDRVVGVL